MYAPSKMNPTIIKSNHALTFTFELVGFTPAGEEKRGVAIYRVRSGWKTHAPTATSLRRFMQVYQKATGAPLSHYTGELPDYSDNLPF